MKTPRAPIRYVAKLHQVREVSLLGVADLDYWTRVLEREGLVPAAVDNRAQVLIVAAAAKFIGLRFCEISFSVLVASPDHGTTGDACYLVQAFNSRRFFAFCERTFYSTPYFHA